MADDERSTLEQLEDALLKFAPPPAGFIAGLIAAGTLRKTGFPPWLLFVLGGAAGSVVVLAVVMLVFHLVNPKRDRSKSNR
jgi:hypothetical protein